VSCRWRIQWLVGAIALGVAPHAYAYRTLSDSADFEGTARDSIVWNGSEVAYFIDDDVPLGLLPAEFQAAVVRAFGAWEGVDCTKVRAKNFGWRRGPASSGDGISSISWVHEGWPAANSAGARTDLVVEQRGGRWSIVEADIFLNAQDYEWTVEAASDASVKSLSPILLHEVGHVLGLSHPCAPGAGVDCGDACGDALAECTADEQGVVMNPVYDVSRTTLSADDAAGICALYPGATCETTGCDDGFACVGGKCLLSCNDAVCPPGDFCTAAGCRPPVCHGGSCDQPCGRDTDCGVGETCADDGACLLGKLPVGAACETNADCELGVCGASGLCRAACVDASSCAAGEACEPPSHEGQWGTCSGGEGVVGAACTTADECSSGHCLTGSGRGNVCTSECATDDACPAAWSCSVVDGSSVCIPLTTSGGCACRLYSRPGQGGPAPGAVAALLALTCLMRRSSRPAPGRGACRARH
jgi:hypothetical protein